MSKSWPLVAMAAAVIVFLVGMALLAMKFVKKKRTRTLLTGLLFISPWIIGFLIFTLYPMVQSLIYSFTNFKDIPSDQIRWYSNYASLFTDPKFWKSLWNTFYLVLFSVPIGILLSFFCAILLNLKVKGQSIYRVIYFLPSIVPTMANTMLWIWILTPETGILSNLLKFFHIQSPNWFMDPLWSKPALIIMGLWGIGGTIIIYLSGLQDVPLSLIESAELDGASWWQRLWHITVPMVSPITLFILLTDVIGTFQYFTQAYVFSRFATIGKSEISLGSPLNSTLFYSVRLYSRFSDLYYGYASAMAWVLFFIILGCTILLIKVTEKSTYYAG
jgi:multiple sugar transport system permease protein